MTSKPQSVALPGFADPVVPGSQKNPTGCQKSPSSSKISIPLPNNVTDSAKSQREGDLQVKKKPVKSNVVIPIDASLDGPTNEPGTTKPQDCSTRTTGVDSMKQPESTGTAPLKKVEEKGASKFSVPINETTTEKPKSTMEREDQDTKKKSNDNRMSISPEKSRPKDPSAESVGVSKERISSAKIDVETDTALTDLSKTAAKPVGGKNPVAEKDPSIESLSAADTANVKVSSPDEFPKPLGENSTAAEKDESVATLNESGATPGIADTKVTETPETKKPPPTPPRTPASVLEQVTSPVRTGKIRRIRARKSVLADSIKSRSPPTTPQGKSSKKQNKEGKGKRKSVSVLESASAAKKSRAAPRVPPKEVFSGSPTENVGIDWTGWTKRTFQRAGGATKGSLDSYWYTPKLQLKLRSLKEVERFVGHLKASNGDEQLAWNKMKGKK